MQVTSKNVRMTVNVYCVHRSADTCVYIIACVGVAIGGVVVVNVCVCVCWVWGLG